ICRFRKTGGIRGAPAGDRHHRAGRWGARQGLSLRIMGRARGSRYHRVWRLGGFLARASNSGRLFALRTESSMQTRRTSRMLVLAFLGWASLMAGCGKSPGEEKGGVGRLTTGFIYIGARKDYGYNQAHALGAAAVRSLAGVKVVEEEMVPDTVDAQKT